MTDPRAGDEVLRLAQAWVDAEVTRALLSNGLPIHDRHVAEAKTALRQALARQSAGYAEPFAYAYVYPYLGGRTVVRFNEGQEVNGCKPIEAIPLYRALAAVPPGPQAEVERVAAELQRALYADPPVDGWVGRHADLIQRLNAALDRNV